MYDIFIVSGFVPAIFVVVLFSFIVLTRLAVIYGRPLRDH